MAKPFKKRCALITGVTGQDGSYLAELLLDKGYKKVVGLRRRTSSFNTDRVEKIYNDPRFCMEWGNMTDTHSLWKTVSTHRPDEIYNLAAQSHVRVSFEVPEETLDVVAGGTLKLLNVVKEVCPEARFYQASSSEMFGDNPAVPQSETTRMTPASPYACAKLYAHNLCRNYREGYGMHISCGILFNHECVEYNTPILVKVNGVLDVCRPVDLISLRRKGTNVQTSEIDNVEIWDGNQWTAIKAITATKRQKNNKDHNVLLTQTRGGVVCSTEHHNLLTEAHKEIQAREVVCGQKLALCSAMPKAPNWTSVSDKLAEFLGYMAGDGYVPADRHTPQFTNNNKELQERVANLWSKLFLGTSRTSHYPSGFKPKNTVCQTYLNGNNELCEWLRGQLYNSDGYKKVPQLILNANPKTQKLFLDAYYACDGLKKGSGKSFVTNSPILAKGLVWMYNLQGFNHTTYVEERNSAMYYRVNIGSDSKKGRHLIKPKSEVRKISDVSNIADDWVFDLETESGVFNAGVGDLVIHNSPRRGETFVTRKITQAAARIKLGKQDILELGNLDAKRDWGYAADFVEAMWLMLQQEKPDDYVVATGETHTVREFLEEVFNLAGLDVEKHVRINKRFFRPHEVPLLLGDSTKSKTKLGWEPKIKFKELAKLMYEADFEAELGL